MYTLNPFFELCSRVVNMVCLSILSATLATVNSRIVQLACLLQCMLFAIARWCKVIMMKPGDIIVVQALQPAGRGNRSLPTAMRQPLPKQN